MTVTSLCRIDKHLVKESTKYGQLFFGGDYSVYLFVVKVESLVAKEIVVIQSRINNCQYVFSYILGGNLVNVAVQQMQLEFDCNLKLRVIVSTEFP